jgi:uncharacterized protein (DUF2141 family)
MNAAQHTAWLATFLVANCVAALFCLAGWLWPAPAFARADITAEPPPEQPTTTPQARRFGTVSVTLSGMKNDKGSLVYAMWSGPEGWLEDNTIREGAAPIENGSSTLYFRELPYGEYAISVYQDRNGNGKLDTGLFGIPKEPFGFSNDPKLSFGPPKYEDSAFTLETPEHSIQIPVKKLF